MLGIDDFWVWSAYLLCILSTLLCIVYGAVTWNKGGDDVASNEDVKWAQEEDKIIEKL
jgi:hypothetical protein